MVVGALPDVDQVGPPPDRVARPPGRHTHASVGAARSARPVRPGPLSPPARPLSPPARPLSPPGRPAQPAPSARLAQPAGPPAPLSRPGSPHHTVHRAAGLPTDQPSPHGLANWEAMDGHAEALIDLDAVARNIEAMHQHVGGVPLMAVVKADGYGHGMIPTAHAAVAGGAQWLGVVHEHEALALRRAGLTTRVLCCSAPPARRTNSAIRDDVDLNRGRGAAAAGDRAAATRAGRPARVQLKIDTWDGPGRGHAG